MKIYIVGAGVGDERYLTCYAKNIIQKAQVVITTKRLSENLGKLNENTVCVPITKIADFIKDNANDMYIACVLVSGDTGFFSISKKLKEQLEGFEIEFINGLSSFQFLTAKLGTGYDDVTLISGHGREVNIVANVCYNKKVFLLTGGEKKAHNFIKELCDAGLTEVLVTVGENLSAPTERIVTDRAQNLLDKSFLDLSVMLVQNDNIAERFKKIADKDFIRSIIPMTKEAVRTLSVAALDIEPQDNIIDVGAGTGSVSIELARKACAGSVLALEQKDEAIELIKANREKFLTYNVVVKKALAPQGLEGFLANKAFIGGSAGNLDKIITTLIHTNGCKKIVVNAVTLETLQEATEVFKQHNLTTNICCVNIANAEKLGNYNLMRAQNPVYIISGELL